MVEAFYKISFVGQASDNAQEITFGTGIVILEKNLIRGGDASYYYIGEYSIKDNVIDAEVSVIHYAGLPNNILGNLLQYDLKLKGNYSEGKILLAGVDKNGPGSVTVGLEKIRDLGWTDAYERLAAD